MSDDLMKHRVSSGRVSMLVKGRVMLAKPIFAMLMAALVAPIVGVGLFVLAYAL